MGFENNVYTQDNAAPKLGNPMGSIGLSKDCVDSTLMTMGDKWVQTYNQIKKMAKGNSK